MKSMLRQVISVAITEAIAQYRDVNLDDTLVKTARSSPLH